MEELKKEITIMMKFDRVFKVKNKCMKICEEFSSTFSEVKQEKLR